MIPHATNAPPEAATPTSRWAPLAALSLAMLIPSLSTSIVTVALPDIAAGFAAPFAAVQWVVLSYLLAVTALVVGAGRLGDILGRRRLLAAGIALFALASLAASVAPTLATLAAAQTLQGIGAAAMMALSVAMTGDVVPKERIGRAMGLLGTMSAVGTTLGPSLGGLLVAGFGWRAVFIALLPPALAALALVWLRLPADARRTAATAPFDIAGTALLAAALCAYALAMTAGGGRASLLNAALLAAALGLGFLFVRLQRRLPAPLLQLSLVTDRARAVALATGFAVSTIVMATLVVGPFHLARGLGLGAAATGLALSAGPLAAALAGVPAGRAVDRIGAARATQAGLAVMTIGLAWLVAAPVAWGAAAYVAGIVTVTTGYALFQAGNNTGVMVGIGQERRGLVSGLLNLARNLGLVTGASAMGALFMHAVGDATLTAAAPPAIVAGMRVTYAVATALALLALGLVAFAARKPVVASQPGE